MSARRRRSNITEERFEPAPLDGPLLEVVDLKTAFKTPRGLARAVDGVSFSLERGRTLGVVGESGSGKTVLSRSIMGLLPKQNVRAVGHGDVRGSRPRGRERRRAAQPLGRAARDGLPGPDDVAEPGHEDRESAHRDAAPAPRHHEGLLEGARARAAPVGGHPRGRAPAEGVPAPDVGRHASTRRHRRGDRLRAEAALRRRAHHRARRDGAGADPRPAPGAAARALHGDDPRHPRPRRRGRDGPTTSR